MLLFVLMYVTYSERFKHIVCVHTYVYLQRGIGRDLFSYELLCYLPSVL